jgi:hypothetical protein
MVADVVAQDVVTSVLQSLVFGEEIHLESAQATELREMPRIAVPTSGQEMVMDDQLVRIGRNEQSLEWNAIHR